MKSILLILLFALPSNTSTILERRDDPRIKVFNLINQFRKEKGLATLQYANVRQVEVDLWAKHLEKRFEHANAGYACENIALNFESAEELFYQWKRSPGHRRNMLLPKIKYCAIGVHEGKYRNHDGAFFGVFRGYHGKLKAVKRQ